MHEPRTAAEFPNARFWALLEERHPEEKARQARSVALHWHRGLPDLDLVITLYVSPSKNRCGVFLGRNEKLGAVDVAERLRPHAARLNEVLGLDPADSTEKEPFVTFWSVNCHAEDNWPAMVDWMVTEASRYEAALQDILRERTDSAVVAKRGDT
ncbi:hypothetical protein [Aquibium microcysteis]|uniref:hypothetical protein n=1 Tax=Aquibium microcysteis TaxID=675281 RepID=UPI00165D297F|nr:hypothetical protein [Aquibium microcysteis]